MKYLLVLLTTICLTSCSSNNEKTFSSVTVDTVFEDSMGVRAVLPINENRVWFAANNGRVGLLDYRVPKLASIKYEDKFLNFRSIAKTDNFIFVLSIENPAVLYRIGTSSNEATTIEEVYVEKNEKVFYDAMMFWDNNEGIAMGDPTDGCLSIIITRDGGKTWNKIPCEQLPATEDAEAAFAASNTNIALFKNQAWLVSGGKRSRVFYTPNRGETWEVYNTPIIQGKAMTGIYSVDFYDDKTGVIFGGNWEDMDYNEGNKAITEDGGKTWNLVSNGAGPGYRSCVQFVPNSNAQGIVAVGSKGISYSADKGKNWKELSKEGFYAFKFVNDSVAYAGGKNRIAKLLFD